MKIQSCPAANIKGRLGIWKFLGQRMCVAHGQGCDSCAGEAGSQVGPPGPALAASKLEHQ